MLNEPLYSIMTFSYYHGRTWSSCVAWGGSNFSRVGWRVLPYWVKCLDRINEGFVERFLLLFLQFSCSWWMKCWAFFVGATIL
jgi:hypothetical protein